MKIGILTFYNVANYGAALQAWALKDFLMSHGHDVEFVNHTPRATADNFYSVLRNSIIGDCSVLKKVVKVFLLPINVSLGLIKISKYRSFVKRFLAENPVQDSIEGYDAVIVGSDQVWNYKLTGGYDPFFWGTADCKGTRPKHIAYAASVNLSNIEDEGFASKALSDFSAISVREKTAIPLLSKYTNKPIHFVCDPTCLVTREAWNKLIDKKLIPEEDYLLIYPVGNVEETIRIGKRIAKERGLKVVRMMSQISMRQDKDTYFYDGPEGFLSKISGAKVVVTSSFHGTILSVIFNRDFYSIRQNAGSNDRALSLLTYLGIEGRLVSSYEQCRECAPINYNEVNSKIDAFRDLSADFLTKSLYAIK